MTRAGDLNLKIPVALGRVSFCEPCGIIQFVGAAAHKFFQEVVKK